MSVQAGKFFDVKKTKDYFDGMNISMDEYIKKSEIANVEYLNFFSTDAFRGKTAKAVKMLVKNRAGQMLDDAVKAQNLVKDSQDFTMSTFAKEVDPAPNARIEYNTLRNIETDFKGFHNKFKSIALSVENIADRLNGEFGSYGYFGKPDSRPVLREYENFCGGDADNTGYLSECIGKLVRFDGMVNSYITSKQIDIHSTTVSARAKSVGAALMTPVAKSPKMAKYEIKTISTEPVAKAGGDKDNSGLMAQYGFTDAEIEYMKIHMPNLLNEIDVVRKYSTSDADNIYREIIKDHYMFNAETIRKMENANTGKFDSELSRIKSKYLENKEVYEAISAETGVPSELICAIHYRENSSLSLNVYLHNGETLGHTTTIVPIGLYFDDFQEAAVDALSKKMESTGISFDGEYDAAKCMTFAEAFNGYGYSNKGRVSPYLYSGTSAYEMGKYDSDGHYNPELVDAQVGVYCIMNALMNE